MRLLDCENLSVAVWGAGKEGLSAIRAIRYLFPRKPLTVLNDAPLTNEQGSALRDFADLRVLTGSSILPLLPQVDIIIRSPSVYPYRSELQQARDLGVLITSGPQLWSNEHQGEKIIVVTGTKGKTTTTHLVAHMLRSQNQRVIMAGNVGTPLLDFFHVTDPPDVWVVELSSYQLTDLDIFPSIVVLLNLFPEHLDWHKTEEQYFRDKLNILKHAQGAQIVANWTDPISRTRAEVPSNCVFFNHDQGLHYGDNSIWDDGELLLSRDDVTLRGDHNMANVCAALTAVKLFGVPPRKAVTSISDFVPVPHRLQILGERDGVLYVDDSISTIPESAMAAIDAFRGRHITLLVGGFERGLDYGKFVQYLVASSVHVVAMPTTGTRIAARMRDASRRTSVGSLVMEAVSLKEAVGLAREITPKGGVILLSPAAPSYDAFTDYQERGRVFAELCGFHSCGIELP